MVNWNEHPPDIRTPTRFGAASLGYRRLLHRALRHYDEQLGPRLRAVVDREQDGLRATHRELTGDVERLGRDVESLAAALLSHTEGTAARLRAQAERGRFDALAVRIDELERAGEEMARLLARLSATQQGLDGLPGAVRALDEDLRGAVARQEGERATLERRVQDLSDGLRALRADVRELAARQASDPPGEPAKP